MIEHTHHKPQFKAIRSASISNNQKYGYEPIELHFMTYFIGNGDTPLSYKDSSLAQAFAQKALIMVTNNEIL